MQRTDIDPLCAAVQRDTRRWLERAVIGLNLCPFAKAVHTRGQIHYAVSRAGTPTLLLDDLMRELHDLTSFDPSVRETTLLMAPDCLAEFLQFNDFLKTADRVLEKLGLEGVIQLASFHPGYQFADAVDGDIANCTNRAPYPTLHLLRESSIDRAVASFPEAEAIFERNLETLKNLGTEGWDRLGIGRTAPHG